MLLEFQSTCDGLYVINTNMHVSIHVTCMQHVGKVSEIHACYMKHACMLTLIACMFRRSCRLHVTCMVHVQYFELGTMYCVVQFHIIFLLQKSKPLSNVLFCRLSSRLWILHTCGTVQIRRHCSCKLITSSWIIKTWHLLCLCSWLFIFPLT